ncbi:unnamed protein product [Lymnaea stagnalis]|uniref:Uncharacterized protein n=1 Tax=Lymnaea stagnalis TaxID=6523 RepID=A0AAV2H7B6_LYMST
MSRKFFKLRQTTIRETSDTRHILPHQREAISGIEFPIGYFEHRGSCDDPEVFAGKENIDPVFETKRANQQPFIEIDLHRVFHSDCEMAAVESYAIKSGLHTVSERVPIDYCCAPYDRQVVTSFLTPLPEDSVSSEDGAESGHWFLGDACHKPGTVTPGVAATITEIDNEDAFREGTNEKMGSDADVTPVSPIGSMMLALPFKRHVSFSDEPSAPSSPVETRPRIQIRLMRVRSTSVADVSKTYPSSEHKSTETGLQRSVAQSLHLSMSNPDMSPKGAGYFKKIKTLFRPKSARHLPILMSASSDQINKITWPEPNTLTHRSKSTSSETSSESLSEDHIKPRGKATISPGKLSKHKYSSKAKGGLIKSQASLPAMNSKFFNKTLDTGIEELRGDDGAAVLSRAPGIPPLERSYSLVRSESRDPNTVNFPRMPSIRKRHCNVRLVHHFTTALPPDQTLESHVIKEATHIQPLEGGEAVVTDVLSNKLVLFDNKGYPKVTFAVEAGSEPWATCVTSDGALAVTLKRQGCVSLWSTSGEPIAEFGESELSAPTGIQCDTKGRFVVADEEANAVCIFNKHGAYQTELTAPSMTTKENQEPGCLPTNGVSFATAFFNRPRYICITKDGNYVISDSANHCIKIFDSSLSFIGQFGTFGRCDGQFKFPYGVASDDAGYIYVADHYNSRVTLFSKDGSFVEHLLTTQDGISRPSSIAVLKSLLYVTHGDLRSNKVSVFNIKIDPSSNTPQVDPSSNTPQI